MKNWKCVTLGFVAGAVCMVGTSALAYDKTIVATLMEKVAYKIDGNVTYPVASKMPINYNGSTYVPLRHFAELMGCEVRWNDYEDMIVVDYPTDRIKEVTKEVEKIVYVEKGQSVDGIVYGQLPMSATKADYDITAKGIVLEKAMGNTKVYVNLKNTQSDNIQLDPDACVLTVDGKDYGLTRIISNQDKRWYDNVRKDKETSGYLAFESIPSGYKNASLKLVVRKTTQIGENETTTTTFHFVNPGEDSNESDD